MGVKSGRILKESKLIFFAAAFLFLIGAGAKADGPGDCINIMTDKGSVSGAPNVKLGLCVYKGIPFAAPPVGALRFAPPEESAAWEGPLDATKFGNECVQFPLGVMATAEPIGNEDCLYLNVWQPVTAAKQKKPVMVFIHGGGFVMGSGSQPWYEGSNLASFGDVIVVTINYRLGPFGFMAHPSFRDAEGHAGNYGFYDQLTALKWVKKNIGNFGGDAGNITIFGESAGGMSVKLHLISPLSKGLFKKAIIESGPAFLMNTTLENAQEKGLKQAAALGCDNPDSAADCLRALDAKQIMRVLKPVMGFAAGDKKDTQDFSSNPIVDGYGVPDNPIDAIRKGAYDKSVKIMAGSNQNEFAIFTMMKKIETKEDLSENIRKDMENYKRYFGDRELPADFMSLYPVSDYPSPKQCYNAILTDVVFTCPTKVMANAMADTGAETYVYYFTKHLMDKGITRDWGAFHSAELFFIFGNLAFMGINAKTPENVEMSKTMMTLWTSFARTGVPAASGAPEWPRYDAKTLKAMRLDLKLAVIADIKKEPCEIIGGFLSGK
ncbi:MAG: carboxylesterase/lipase family protein [bacterium]